MRRHLLAITVLFFIAANSIFSQSTASVDIKTLEGKIFNTKEIKNDGKPVIISFWATWCKPCVKELSAISEIYEDMQEDTGVKLYAISVDNARSSSRVAPFVNARGWDFTVLLDPNGDFKRAMNVVNVPHTFVLDGNGKIVWQHTSYADGDEEELYEVLKKLVKK
ncbi:MAG: TlpA family protein disulfide reductase [Bacteroidales bacterium]|nr:TlpA family protein disulfide reductase [Bacteroidales bacterium]